MLSFEELYESYAPEVFRFALRLAGERAEAEDITQETFVRAWSRRNGIRTETLKAYLLRIARNVFLDDRRRNRRRASLDETLADPAPGPHERAQSRLELALVDRTLAALPEIDRSAFALRVQHGLPYEEIARVLELSLSSVKVKVHRVRKKLLIACMDREVR